MLRKIKNNRFIRGAYFLWKSYFGLSKKDLGYCGKNVSISEGSCFSNPENVYMYDNTNIYSGAKIICSRARFIMKRNSGAAQGLTVVTGGHMSIPGKLFKDITDEDKNKIDTNKSFDKDVVVEEDVWIGTNVTLLSGVNIGRGAIVGSGTVVRKNVPPYSIVMGNPAKVVGFKFTTEEIIAHEEALYNEEERLNREYIEKAYNTYFYKRINEIKQFTKL